MNKTSRRSFGKRVTGALVALPIASLATTPGASAQTGNQPKTPGPRPVEIESMHDTPPPVLISDGSLIIESDQQFNESGGGQNPFLYTGTGRPKIGHIRVIQDNGDKIYEDLNADTPVSSIIDIEWINEDKDTRGHMVITGGSEFKIESDKEIRRQAQAVKKKRMHKYDHQGVGPNKRIRIESIEITNPRLAKTKFTAMPTGTADTFLPDEFRILIWRHN